MSSGSGVRARSRRVRTPQVLETEPHMSLQRPSSSWSQEIAHILDRCFGAVCSEQSIEVETIRNFTPASDPESYNTRFAERLKKALHQFDSQNELLDSANKRNSDLHTAFIDLFAAEQFHSPAPTLTIPPKNAPDKSLLDLSLFDQTSLISPDSYYPDVFTRYPPPTRDPGVRPSYELTTQNWTEKGKAEPLIKDTTVIRHQPHSNTSRTLKSQFKNKPKTKHETHTRQITPPKQQKQIEKFISSVNSENYFISEPNELLFDQYEPSHTYTGNIVLRNVSRYLREFRVFPPKTEYFSFAEQEHEFNIAPGMTSLISVVFKPDSFGDYSDQIKVVSEDKKSFFIPLLASRPSPVLSLPYCLDCGHSIINTERKISFNCSNSGGSSYFTFSNENVWKNPLIEIENSTEYLSMNKFIVSPVTFELQNGKSLEINITFLAETEGEFVEEIFLHCSNKTTILFELFGESHLPRVEIQSLNQSDNPLIPTTMDEENGIQIASQMLTCPPVTFGHSSQLEVTIKNIKPIPLEVKWVFMSSENNIGLEASTDNASLIGNSNFTISPEKVTINPSENHNFNVIFTPSRVDTYYVCIQLLLLSTNRSPVIATLCLIAECREVCIIPSPPIIVTSGQHLIGSVVKQSIQLLNHGCSPVRINWLTESFENYIEISPTSCDMAPEQNIYFSVHISRSIPGVFEYDLLCQIEDNNTLVVPLKCQFRGANITINQLDMNLGLVSLESTINRTFTLTNNDNTTAFIDIQTRDLNLLANTVIQILPNSIEMPAFSNSHISLDISPINTGNIDSIIQCTECIGGSTALLPVTGLIQRPIVITGESPLISLGDIFVNVPVVTMVTLKNLSKLPAEFEWDTSIQNSEFSDDFRVNFSPQNGTIKGTDSCEVEVEIVCLQILGSVKDILIVCNVENADEPVLLSVSCEVNGMSVEFSHKQNPLLPEPNLVSLDFGTVPIGTKNELSFVVRNNTGIASPIKLWVDKFPANLTAGEKARDVRRPGQEFDVYLGEDTLRKRMEFDEKSVWKAYLSTGQGACVLVQSEHAIMSPHSSNTVRLTAFSNMWGEYTDTLYCQIEGIDSAFGFKFKINVIGCPLHLHSMPEVQQPIVRFGIHPFEKARVSRKIRINNTSPCDIRIDWRVFTQVSHGDHNVVDFEMTYGNPFPSHSRTITYSDQCVLESDLISVFLRPHDSIQNTNTFMITPEQCTIEGYSNVTCEFTFFPTANNLSELGEDISGYALGYLSLDVPPEYPDSVYRPQGKLISPLRVDFHGGIMHPKIEIAPVNSDLDEEVLGFAFPASKLMKINSLGQFQSIKSAYQTFQQITIQNPTKQKLSFDIILPSELKISEYNQLAPNESSDLFSLKPNQIVTLKIGFTLEAKHITSSLDTTQTDWSIQTNKDEHKYLTYKQNIRVEFPSKIAQFLSVEARIELPLLKLSTDVINFGETQIGEKFSQQFCVYNYARKCYSKWRADIRPDDSSILAIDCNEGLLPGFDGGFDFSSKILLISFSPLDEIDYEFEVIISGEFLEIPLSLKVYGSGSII